jgi:alkylation response protein AidB-like acyl-CoA dehydrogenase
MNFELDTELLAIASNLGPMIAEHSAEGEENRRVSPVVMDAMKAAGLVRMVTPKSLGGLEADPVTCARVVEEVSRFDSATGWTLQAANSGDFYCARLPDSGSQEIYANGPDVMIALAISPPMKGTPVEGGFRVTGQNPLGSNISDADWLMTFIASPDFDGWRGAFIPKKDLTVIDTWQSMGMRGTDSNDVAVDDAFVPTDRTWPLQPEFEPGSHFGGPLYAYPSLGEGIFILPPVGLGIATQAVDEFKRLALAKTPFMSATSLRERPVAQMALGKAEGVLHSARSFFYEAVAEAWERTVAGQASTTEEKGKLFLAAVHLMQSSVEVVDYICGVSGTSGIYTRSPMERAFRDIHTLRHHGFVSESRYGTYSQVVLGLEPDFPLAVFGPVAQAE